jgi:hypothetical protein
LAEAAPEPASANPANPASLTPAQVQEWSYVLGKVSENKWVVPAIVLAGVAAVFEIVHIIWLMGRFIYFYFAR